MKKFFRAASVPAVFLLTLSFMLAYGLAAVYAAPAGSGSKPVRLVKLIMLPSTLQLYPGQTGDLTVQAIYSDKTAKDVTAEADWVSSKPAVATVDGGKVTAGAIGSARITAIYGGKKMTRTVTVRPDKLLSLTADPAAVSVNQGAAEQIILTAKYRSGKEEDVTDKAAWSTSKPDIATVDDGEITGVKPGTAIIIAKYENKVIKVGVTVKEATLIPAAVTVDPTSVTLSENGDTKTIAATVKDKDGNILSSGYTLDWYSDNTAVATVENGTVTPRAAGSAVITVTVRGTDLNASCAVTVKPAAPNVFDGTPTARNVIIGYMIQGKVKADAGVTRIVATSGGKTAEATTAGGQIRADGSFSFTIVGASGKITLIPYVGNTAQASIEISAP